MVRKKKKSPIGKGKVGVGPKKTIGVASAIIKLGMDTMKAKVKSNIFRSAMVGS